MTATSTMSCEYARGLFTELVCDELDADAAALVRAHVAGCEVCRPELAKLARVMSVASTLPMLEPSPRVEQRIMQAAREALAAKASSVQHVELPPPERGFMAWFARLSAWAMSPQVAMASVLLLMVGIGLYALPLGHEPEKLTLEANDEAQQAPAPSATATAVSAPESPEKEESAAEQRALRQGGGKGEALRRSRPGKKAVMREGPADKAGDYAAKAESSRDAFADTLDDGAPKRAPSERLQKPSPAAPGRKDARELGAPRATAAPSSGGGQFAPPPPSPAPAQEKRKDSSREEELSGAQNAAPASAASGAPKTKPSEVSKADTGAAPNEDWARESLKQGIAAAQRRAYAEAIKLLQPVVSKGPASTLAGARLWLARSLRGQGNCAGALAHYAPLTRTPSASRAVLEEAADCSEKTGDIAQAGTLRARAQAADSPK